MTTETSKLYTATSVWPVDQPPIADGCVAVENDRILFVGPYADCPFDISNFEKTDLGNAAIIPGLVNAHTHLEFSHLTKPLGHAGIAFTDWVRLVVAQRQQSEGQLKHQSIEDGIRQSFESGVWAIGEIATDPFDDQGYAAAVVSKDPTGSSLSVEICLYLEQLGSDPNRLAQQQMRLQTHLKADRSGNARLSAGASPHAPYSVSPALLSQICDISTTAKAGVAMHVAETKAEIELLDRGAGEFVDLLKDFGVWDQSSFPPERNVMSILRQLASTPRSMVVHGNYLTEQEMDFIATQPGMTVVYCPRTHRFFQHDDYPLLALRDRGINVAVGTDSRASNPDLSLFAELQLIAAEFPQLSSAEILEMGTLVGAKALGFDEDLGTLTVGKRAAISVVRPAAGGDGEADRWLFAQGSSSGPVDGGLGK